MRKLISRNNAKPACGYSLTLIAALLVSQNVSAHGFMSSPPSRAALCQQGANTDCGGAQYEPQSVGETFKGFPAGSGGAPLQGPIDGKIASGGNVNFDKLDTQTATRWHLNEIKDRNIDFVWTYTASHPATKHEYFITQNGWNPNQSLKRSTFEATPFCTIEGNNQKPVSGTKHACVIPDDKTGQHVILGVWTVGDTDMAFHNVVDVNIVAEAALPGGWNSVGSISPSITLLPGDKVKARAFDSNGENSQYGTEISIQSAEAGQMEKWSFALAEKLNSTHKLVRAGVRDDEGNIEPVLGQNKIYAQKESGIIRYEVTPELVEDSEASMSIGNLAPEHELVKGEGSVIVPIANNRTMAIEVTVFNEKNKQVGFTRKTVAANSTASLAVDVRSEPGEHGVSVVGTTEDGRTTRQDFKLTALTGEGGALDFDFQFPDNITEYKAGTKVLQPKNGNVYECKPFPNSGYCTQYNPNANGFEPGIGAHWQSAWEQK